MERSISAREANQHFSRILGEVRDGKSFVVTSHGKAVAKIEPIEGNAPAAAAREVLFARLRAQQPVEIGKWSRDEIYER
jgi:prevent-host-death family protein